MFLLPNFHPTTTAKQEHFHTPASLIFPSRDLGFVLLPYVLQGMPPRIEMPARKVIYRDHYGLQIPVDFGWRPEDPPVSTSEEGDDEVISALWI